MKSRAKFHLCHQTGRWQRECQRRDRGKSSGSKSKAVQASEVHFTDVVLSMDEYVSLDASEVLAVQQRGDHQRGEHQQEEKKEKQHVWLLTEELGQVRWMPNKLRLFTPAGTKCPVEVELFATRPSTMRTRAE